MARFLSLGLVLASSSALLADLTPDQRAHDFQNMAALYAKRYAPLEWKKTAFNFDLLDLRPWLDRVRRAASDAEYHEIAAEYVARLEDTHSSYTAPGSFAASLGIAVDVYDNVVLIDAIDRVRYPAVDYPFQIGDEIVSVDGRTAEEWITLFSRYRRMGNPRATRRNAADWITFRRQAIYPRATEIGDTAEVVIRRQTGDTERYTLRWEKTNLAFPGAPTVPGPRAALLGKTRELAADEPEYIRFLNQIWNWSAPSTDSLFYGEIHDENGNVVPRKYVLGVGARNPWFQLPEGFVIRLGRTPQEFHFSGTYESSGLRIGYLRLPNFAPGNVPGAIQELENEIRYLNGNTDGLVVDVTRNTGGGCYMLDVAKRLINYDFWFFGEEIRPTWDRVNATNAALEAARRGRADQWIIDVLQHNTNMLLEAYRAGAPRTGPVSSCTQFMGGAPTWFNTPAEVTYTKPMILLIDEFSISAGDIFPAMIQDNQRALLVGMRSNGAGGSVSGWPVGLYTEAVAGNTNTLVLRREIVANAPDMPVSRYLENVGVRPDVQLDAMSRENLLNRFRPYVNEFTRIIVERIQAQR